MLLLFALGLGLSQSRWSSLVCSMGLTVSMLSDERGKRRDALRHVASCCSLAAFFILLL